MSMGLASRHTDEVEQDFDRIANSYTRFRRAFEYDEMVIGLVNHFVPGAVLAVEVGSGSGDLAGQLARSVRSVIGYDLSRGMVDLALRRYRLPNLDFRKTDGSPLRRTGMPGAPDCLISKFSVHDLADAEDHLAAWIAAVASTGVVIVVDRYWEATAPRRLWADLRMIPWLWRRFRRSSSLVASLKHLIEDQVEWYSPKWRHHRKVERRRTLVQTRKLLEAHGALEHFEAVNSSSYAAVLRPRSGDPTF